MCVSRLDRKWLLWHDFMRERAHLEAWLRSAERAVACASSAHITYAAAKEQLRTIEVSWFYRLAPASVLVPATALRNAAAVCFRGCGATPGCG